MSVAVHAFETLTGRIIDTIPVTSLRWADTLNAAGAIDVTVAEEVVRQQELRQKTHGARCSLAVEQDGRIKQAGPIWARSWDRGKGQLRLGAAGIWSLADRRVIYDDASYPSGILTFTGSLGGIVVGLASHMLNFIPPYTSLPIVLPAVEAGDRTESFARWELSRYGEQWRQLTQRAVDAPDIAFPARRTAADPRYIEWVMRVGTEAAPSLTQAGAPWVFDASAPKSSVKAISTDEDATQMATATWASGNGMEADMKQARGFDDGTLLGHGWPYMEVDESHPTVDDYTTLLGHADSLMARSGRPIEVYKVTVTRDAAREVTAGDHCQVITKNDVWLGSMNETMRVRQVSGGLGDDYVLEMFPLQASL